jgi:hypothetical protein
VIRWAGRAIAAWAKPRADLIVENLCLRQQLIVLPRRAPRPRLRDGDRRFWIFVCRWFPKWRDSLLVVQPNTVLRWHHRGWTAHWRWRSRQRTRGGRPPLPRALRALIRRMSVENRRWGQRRVQAELARLGFPVAARTVAKYMRRPYDGVPSRHFLITVFQVHMNPSTRSRIHIRHERIPIRPDQLSPTRLQRSQASVALASRSPTITTTPHAARISPRADPSQWPAGIVFSSKTYAAIPPADEQQPICTQQQPRQYVPWRSPMPNAPARPLRQYVERSEPESGAAVKNQRPVGAGTSHTTMVCTPACAVKSLAP